jgi:hypothetical protein
MADQDQPLNAGEPAETLGDFVFGVLAGRLERRSA